MVIKIDLSKQEYPVFRVDSKNYMLEFGPKNIIYGKNGSGKSTLCRMIEKQLANEYNVQVFSGFENIAPNNKLNAIVLGEENIKAEKEISLLEEKINELENKKERLIKELKSLEWDDSFEEEGITKHILVEKKQRLEKELKIKRKEIEKFYQDKAKILREFKEFRITKSHYNKNDFEKDIPASKLLSKEKFDEYKTILQESIKNNVRHPVIKMELDLKKLLEQVNEITTKKIVEFVGIEELKDDPKKMSFAKLGLEIHEAGDKCSFCGNVVREERIEKIKTFVSSSDVQKLQNEIHEMLDKLEREIDNINSIEELEKKEYYEFLQEKVDSINDEIRTKKKEYESFLSQLKDRLQEKNRNLFLPLSELKLRIPENFSQIIENIINLKNEHLDWTKKLEEEKEKAKKELRLHFVAEFLNERDEYQEGWKGYEVEMNQLKQLEQQLIEVCEQIDNEIKKLKGDPKSSKEDTLSYIENEIEKMEHEIHNLVSTTKSTYKFVEIINEKLKMSGKDDLELILVKDHNGIEHYQIKDGDSHRPINKLSTGEKNIIAFLYFIEKLEDTESDDKRDKIIIFDDPMNSNDDAMQYLMITELQKLYNGRYESKFNKKKDYLFCLTHNAHFYLNLPLYHNNRKYKYYDIYHLRNGDLIKINSPDDDFNTQYEALWIELKQLYEKNLINSMLNVMRRIIETYIRFNKLDENNFYYNKEEHRKLFNANSHSVNDLSAEMIAKDRETILKMFKNLFESNHAIEHFKAFWDSHEKLEMEK